MQEQKAENKEKNKARENAECMFPPCPKCEEGFLLPFSRGEDVFEKWKCSECGYTIEKR